MAQDVLTGADKRHRPRTISGDFAYKRFGRETYSRESSPLVGASATLILPNNPDRLFWSMHNRSASDITIAFNSEVTPAIGIVLIASVGWISQAIQEDGNVVAWEVYAIGPGAGLRVYIFEILGS